MIKKSFEFEQYLDIHVLHYGFRITMTKFRLSNHRLPIERGRWNNTPLLDRSCPLCTPACLGDEFHYLFQCKSLTQERTTNIPKYMYKHPNTHKAGLLFDTQNQQTLRNISKFMKIINTLLLEHEATSLTWCTCQNNSTYLTGWWYSLSITHYAPNHIS